MVSADHRVCPGAARRARPPRPLARAGATDAGQVDWPQRGRPAPFPPARIEVQAGRGLGARRGLQAGKGRGLPHPPDTLFGMSFLALAPEHPLALAVADRDPAAAAFVAECRRLGTSEAVIES